MKQTGKMNETLFQVICITFAIGTSVNSYAASLISVSDKLACACSSPTLARQDRQLRRLLTN
jgi:hypothetical protein